MEQDLKGPPFSAPFVRGFLGGIHRNSFLALAGYGLLTLFLLHPHELKLGDHLPQDLGDQLQTCWMTLWQIDRFESGFDSYFTTNAFHPYRGNLAFTDYQPLIAVLLWPLYRGTGNIVLAYNLLYILAFILSGWACYLLARRWFGDETGAFLAGIVFAYCGYRFDHLAHLQLLWCPWIPLALLTATEWLQSGRYRYVLCLMLLIVLQAATSVYYFFYLVLAVGLLAGCWILLAGKRPLFPEFPGRSKTVPVRRWTAVLVLTLSLAAAGLVAGLMFIPYLQVRREYGFQPEFIDRFSATLASLWTAPWSNWLYGRWTEANRQGETNYLIGLTAVVLVCCNFFHCRPAATESWKTPRWAYGVLALVVAGSACLFWLEFLPKHPWSVSLRAIQPPASANGINLVVFIALSVFLLVFGPFRGRMAGASIISVFILALAFSSLLVSFKQPARTLFNSISMLSFLRTPGRIGVLVVLATALGAASGYRALARRIGRARWASVLGVVLALAMVAEYSPGSFYSVPFSVDSRALPPIYRHLESLDPGKEVLLELPMDHIFYDTRASVYSAFHGLPTVNGQSAYMPKGYLDFMDRMNRRFPSVEAIPWIRERGITLVAVHYEYLPVARRSVLDPHGAESEQARQWRKILDHLRELDRVGEFGTVDLFRVIGSSPGENASLEFSLIDAETEGPAHGVWTRVEADGLIVGGNWAYEATYRCTGLKPGTYRIITQAQKRYLETSGEYRLQPGLNRFEVRVPVRPEE